MNKAPIGIFDSGMGGLTVLKEVMRVLPSESTIYLGDTARVPYGIRSAEAVIRYTHESMSFLLTKNIKMLVIACNTASAVSLEEIKKHCPVPVIGVIGPGARAAVKATRTGRIGVIGTEATIRSGSYVKAIGQISRNAKVVGLSCPLFVPLAEEGLVRGDIAELTARKYLSKLKGKDIDTLLLGCTHYPLLKPTIARVMGGGVRLIDSAIETAKEIQATLDASGDAARPGRAASRRYFVTDGPEKFRTLGSRFLGRRIDGVRIARL